MADPLESITLGGGCFWCIEAVMQRLRGVDTVISGYAGGSVPNPTYKQICTGTTGHAEVVQVHFDPAVISLDELLYVFFRLHDPTTLNRQGADVGTQYRSIILYTSEAQRDAAQQAIDSVNAEKLYPNPVVTQVVPLELFYPAEDYHQDYYNQNSTQPYCRAVIDPKVQKLLKSYGQYLKD
jgi:peptide-methionine (S)-S-oxide reductase